MLMKMRSKMQKANNQKGFTLVELMVVVVILGILVAIAVPIYNSVTDKAELSSIKANLRTIDGAITAYEANNEGTTPTAENLTDAADQYIKVWPTEPGTYSINDDGAAEVEIENGEGGLDNASYTLANIGD